MSTPTLRRRASRVLAAFVAVVCVTLIAPFVHAVDYERVCSVQGDRLIAVAADEHPASGPHDPATDPAAHCPLCLPAGVPPAFVAWRAEPVQPLAHVLRPIPAARLAGLVGAPLPARGPPSLS